MGNLTGRVVPNQSVLDAKRLYWGNENINPGSLLQPNLSTVVCTNNKSGSYANAWYYGGCGGSTAHQITQNGLDRCGKSLSCGGKCK